MDKQRIIGILIFLCLIVGLSSCRSTSDAPVASNTIVEAAEQEDQHMEGIEEGEPSSAVSEIPGFGKDAEQNMQIALANCVGWGATAGSSMDAVIAACTLMSWANDNSLKDSSATAVDTMLKTCYNNLNLEEQKNFKSNWTTISDTADVILTDYEAIAETVKDSGSSENVEMIRTNVNSASNWAELKTGFNRLLSEG